jgi:uncharacterized protein (DUF2147 family)
MSKSRKKAQSTRQPVLAASGRRWRRVAAVLAVVAIVAAVGFWWSKGRPHGAQPAPASASEFEKLTGRWQRPDGGYILEILNVEPGGKMRAAYFNPRPINVAKAEASRKEGSARVIIELRDVNYPGSTYNLTYDPADDRLKGIYFQAAVMQAFDVYFVRLQP